jgi:uncharacterized membrane protein YdjX (TVP38/TMEM64 family)
VTWQVTSQAKTTPTNRGWILRIALLAAVIVAVGSMAVLFRDEFSLDRLAGREQELRDLYEEHPVLVLGAALLVYVVVTALSLPGAAAMSVVYGWLFGFWPALVVVSFASTGGASLAFLMSRYLFGQALQDRYEERLKTMNAAIAREGALYLFTLRLIPQVPFFVVNVAMGLTKMRLATFWWVSQLGMLPGTCVFVFAGASVPSLKVIAERGIASVLDWRLAAALALVGITPLLVKRLVDGLQRRDPSPL